MIRKAQEGLDIKYINSPSQNKEYGNTGYKQSGLDYSKGVSDARNFLSNWITKRKETGNYDDQLQELGSSHRRQHSAYLNVNLLLVSCSKNLLFKFINYLSNKNSQGHDNNLYLFQNFQGRYQSK